jgi:acyl carrier protein
MVRDQIRAFLAKNSASGDAGEFSDTDSLLESGIIDSVTMVDLIAHIESTFDVHVDEDEMTPENFNSVAAITGYVERKIP